MSPQDFLELRSFISITKHIPGHITMKLAPRIVQHPAARHLASLSGGRVGSALLNASFNILFCTLALDYDPERICPEDLDAFLSGQDDAQAAQRVQKVAGLLGIPLEYALSGSDTPS